MFMHKKLAGSVMVAMLVAACASTPEGTITTPERGPNLGATPSAAKLAAMDISIPPSGAGLPAGGADARAGAKVYAAKCASCHGPKGEGKPADRLVGGQGTLTKDNYGRDHHPRCFTMWLAGGGTKPGIVHGATDDFGYNIADGGVHVHDLHATMLHLLGFDHEKLTWRFQGRDFRLTDVAGRVVRELLA